jgi:hypothetical protein
MRAYGLTAPCGETPDATGRKKTSRWQERWHQKRQGRLSATPEILTK